MGGPPAQDLIISLVEFSVAAFAVTVVLLLNAKWILSAAKQILSAAKWILSPAQKLPIIALKRATEKSFLKKSGTGQKSEHQQDLHGAFGSAASFWLAYIIVEIPALRVLRAVTAMKKGKVSGAAAANVALGVIFMPVFGTSCLLRIVTFNIRDLIWTISSKYSIRTYIDRLSGTFFLTFCYAVYLQFALMKHSLTSAPVEEDGESGEDEELFLRRFHKIKGPTTIFQTVDVSRKVRGGNPS